MCVCVCVCVCVKGLRVTSGNGGGLNLTMLRSTPTFSKHAHFYRLLFDWYGRISATSRLKNRGVHILYTALVLTCIDSP